MGNREALLAGAKRCLYEKGYARTTARDIASAAGTSLAAIGYHYRSTEALLNAALFQAMEEWGDEIARAMAAEIQSDAGPLERFEAIWTRVLESFHTNRQLWATQLEIVTQAEHLPEVRGQLAAGLQGARIGLAELFQHTSHDTDTRIAESVGSFHQALLTGVLVQWLIDPEHAPSGTDLAQALKTISADISGYSADTALNSGNDPQLSAV